MDAETRDLCLELIDGDLRVMPIAHGLTEFVHFKKIAKWLVKNKLTGKELLDWYSFRFKNRRLQMASYIIMKVNKEYKQRKIYAKDLIGRA